MGPARYEPMTLPPCPLLHIVQISFFSDPQGREPEQLLEAWATLVDVAEAASRRGARVSVLQACVHSRELERNGVRYFFLPFGECSAPDDARALGPRLRQLAPDVLHVHGLGFHRDIRALAAAVPDIPIIVQDHASRLPRPWRRGAWRRGLSVADGIAFCAARQAQPFASAGLLAARTRVYEIPESTSRFAPGDRETARRLTGLQGDPLVLWVGNLDDNKDPLTILEGVSTITSVLPGLRLFCCFGTAPLLRQVQQRIASDSRLREHVTLLGRVPHGRIEQLMRAADFFVLGSHHEGSGYALIEALACGLPPVVTDIPSFRSLTGNGAVGSLWPCGDAHSLAAALRLMAMRCGAEARVAVRAHFERELSLDSLGSKLIAMYADIRDRHHRGTPSAPCVLPSA